MFGAVPFSAPCVGPATTLKVSVSPSGSEPVNVMALPVSSTVVTVWALATGARLTGAPAVVKVQVDPVVVVWPSLTVTYHSYSVFAERLLHVVEVFEPEGTFAFVPITAKGTVVLPMS